MNKSLQVAAVLAMFGDGMQFLPAKLRRSAKDICAQCHKGIPPGRAGRRCEECRTMTVRTPDAVVVCGGDILLLEHKTAPSNGVSA